MRSKGTSLNGSNKKIREVIKNSPKRKQGEFYEFSVPKGKRVYLPSVQICCK